MEQYKETEVATDNSEISIFDDLKPLPVYYSEKAVFVFSVLFGVFFGAILMAINFKNTEGKKGIWQVLVFGVAFTTAEVASMVPAPNSGLTLAFNIGGGYILNRLFWGKFIGKNINYTRRSVLVPAIIAVAIVVLIVVAILESGALYHGI